MITFKKYVEEAKQGHALVVGGKIIARGSKSQLMKKIKKDKIKIDHLSEIHNYILHQFYENGIELLGIYYCPDHPDQATQYRKPGPKMFNQASEDHQIDLQRSIMIGDALSDLEAGVNLRMDTMLVLTGRGKDTQQNLGSISPTYIMQDLMDGANKLIGIR